MQSQHLRSIGGSHGSTTPGRTLASRAKLPSVLHSSGYLRTADCAGRIRLPDTGPAAAIAAPAPAADEVYRACGRAGVGHSTVEQGTTVSPISASGRQTSTELQLSAVRSQQCGVKNNEPAAVGTRRKPCSMDKRLSK